MKHTEHSIQNLLFAWTRGKGHKSVVPNCGVFGWEADLISVTQSLNSYEYEIKISKTDFKADAKKKKHKRMIGDQTYGFQGPNRFYYVVPQGLVTAKEVPKHAGLIYVTEKSIKTIKKAPMLHSKKLPQSYLEYIQRGLMLRYWSKRVNTIRKKRRRKLKRR